MNDQGVSARPSDLFTMSDVMRTVAGQLQPIVAEVDMALTALVRSRSEYIAITVDHRARLQWHVTSLYRLAAAAGGTGTAFAEADSATAFAAAVEILSGPGVWSPPLGPPTNGNGSNAGPLDDTTAQLTFAITRGDYDEAARIIGDFGRNHSREETADLIASAFSGRTSRLDDVARRPDGVEAWTRDTQRAFLDAAQRLLDTKSATVFTAAGIVEAYTATPQAEEVLLANGKFIKDLSALLNVARTDAASITVLSHLDTATLVLMVKAILFLGDDQYVSDNDFRAFETLFAALAEQSASSPDAAFAFMQDLGAENFNAIVTHLRFDQTGQRPWMSEENRPIRDLLDDLDAVVAAATRSSRYRVDDPTNEVNRYILTGDVHDVALLLAGHSTFDSDVLAMLAARILLSPASAETTLLGIDTSDPYWSPRQLVLDALDADLAGGGDAAETYLFGPHSGDGWGTFEERITTLLKVPVPEQTWYLWVPDPDNGTLAGEILLAAASQHFASGGAEARHDVLDLLDTVIGSKDNGGGDTTDFGRFALAHLFSLVLSDPVLSADFENYVRAPGAGRFLDSSYEDFRTFIGNIADSELGLSELMIGMAGYLQAQGAGTLMSAGGSSDAGKVIGVLLESVRTHFNDKEHSSSALTEFLLTTVLLVAVASTGGWAATLATGPTAKVIVAGIVELAKNGAKNYAKEAAASGSSAPVEDALRQASMLFLTIVFPALPHSVQTTLRADPAVSPFITNGTLTLPVVGDPFPGTKRTVTDADLERFFDSLTDIALANRTVATAVDSFQRDLDRAFARHPS